MAYRSCARVILASLLVVVAACNDAAAPTPPPAPVSAPPGLSLDKDKDKDKDNAVVSLGPSCAAISLDGLVRWYTGDKTVTDQSPFHASLTAKNGATFAAGKVGFAFSLNGVDQWFEESGHPHELDLSTATLDAWVYPTKDGTSILDKPAGNDDKTNYRFVLGVGDEPTRATFPARRPGLFVNPPTDPNNLGQSYHTNDQIPLNAWSHIAVTVTKGTIQFYINGQPVSSQLFFGPGTPQLGPPGAGALFIGRDILGRFFGGLIDEVEIFNRILSAAEIKAIYDAGSAGKCQPVSGVQVVIRNKFDDEDFNFDGKRDADDDIDLKKDVQVAFEGDVSQINISTIRFGNALPSKKPEYKDVDKDKDKDLVLTFHGKDIDTSVLPPRGTPNLCVTFSTTSGGSGKACDPTIAIK